MEIIILAGGQAKRLRPVTEDLPKCMVPINGKPTLEYHLNFLKKSRSINKIVLAESLYQEINQAERFKIK